MRPLPQISVVLLMGIGLIGCASVNGDHLPVEPSAAPVSEICFHAAHGSTFRQLEGVEVLLVTSQGTRSLGVTSSHRMLCVPKGELRGDDARAILFCREGFFCGAFRLDENVGGRDLLSFSERVIVLAPFVIL